MYSPQVFPIRNSKEESSLLSLEPPSDLLCVYINWYIYIYLFLYKQQHFRDYSAWMVEFDFQALAIQALAMEPKYYAFRM